MVTEDESGDYYQETERQLSEKYARKGCVFFTYT